MKDKIIKFSGWALFFFVGINILFYAVDYFNTASYDWFDRSTDVAEKKFYAIHDITVTMQFALAYGLLILAPLWPIFSWLHFKAGNQNKGFLYLLLFVVFFSMYWRNYEPFELFMRFYEIINGSSSIGGVSRGYSHGSPAFGFLTGGLATTCFLSFKFKNSPYFFNSEILVSRVFQIMSKMVYSLHYYLVFWLGLLFIAPTFRTSRTLPFLNDLGRIVEQSLPIIYFGVMALLVVTVCLVIFGRFKHRFYLRKPWFGLLILDIVFIACATLWFLAIAIASV